MSLWWTLVDHPVFEPGELQHPWDVVIVGGGFSGLWTAHHLIEQNPALKIAILEMNQVGSGASGRNGGWASALYPVDDKELRKTFSPEVVHELHMHLRQTIDDVADFISKENIDCGFQKAGSLIIARNQGQFQRLGTHIEEGYVRLDVRETNARIRMRGALGSVYTPNCASLNPAALVVGLANSLQRRGVSIFENTPAFIQPEGAVLVDTMQVRATFVVRAIEAYLENTRDQVPIYSLMIASEPLPSEVLQEIGVENRETFAEASHLVTYAQRTADGRLAIGGRGAPYTWRSRRNDASEHHRRDHDRLRKMAREWFPVLEKFEFNHSWGGAVGVTRDWAPYVRTGENYGEMGGYAGDGVAFSYLAGGVMADLILEKDSARTHLPFVQWRGPRWEPEPFRWIGINSAIRLSGMADKEEKRRNRPSRIMKILSKITGQ